MFCCSPHICLVKHSFYKHQSQVPLKGTCHANLTWGVFVLGAKNIKEKMTKPPKCFHGALTKSHECLLEVTLIASC